MKLTFEEVGYALEIMGKGMLGIFAVIIILTLIVMLLPYISKLVDSIQKRLNDRKQRMIAKKLARKIAK